ncbi:hypothetical protein ACFQV8_02385 [Pseudonocardia benzenivorans]
MSAPAGSPVAKKNLSMPPSVENARNFAVSDSTQNVCGTSRGAQAKSPGRATITSSPT